MAAANATRPILPVNGGVRQVNVLMNLGEADYNGLQTQISYRGNSRLYAALSYTLSKATNTTEPDGNGIGPNQSNISRLGDEERGPSLLDQRHRAVITFSYQLPFNITAGTLTQFASARPFNATTGIDNNGDGANNDRPVVNGQVMREVGVPRHADVRRRRLRREAHPTVVRLGTDPAPRWKASTSSITATTSAAARRSTATRARRTRRSASSSPSARRRTRSRRSPTSTRRGCSSCRCGSFSEYRSDSAFAIRESRIANAGDVGLRIARYNAPQRLGRIQSAERAVPTH